MSTKKTEDLILSPLELAILLEATATRIRKSLEGNGVSLGEIDRALDLAKRLVPLRPKRRKRRDTLRKMSED